MANMSANILRNIVSSILKVKPTEVKLSGNINPEFVPLENRGHSWWDGAETQRDNLWGYSSSRGLISLDIKKEFSFSDNGEQFHSTGESLVDFLERTEQLNNFLFFVVSSKGKHYGENGQYWASTTVFNTVDFQTLVDRRNEVDQSRWENWIEN